MESRENSHCGNFYRDVIQAGGDPKGENCDHEGSEPGISLAAGCGKGGNKSRIRAREPLLLPRTGGFHIGRACLSNI